MVTSKKGQRICGSFMFVIGGSVIGWWWYNAIYGEFCPRKASAVMLILTSVGLAMLLFPIDCDKVLAEHGVQYPETLGHYPLIWRVWTYATIVAAVGNYLAMTAVITGSIYGYRNN